MQGNLAKKAHGVPGTYVRRRCTNYGRPSSRLPHDNEHLAIWALFRRDQLEARLS